MTLSLFSLLHQDVDVVQHDCDFVVCVCLSASLSCFYSRLIGRTRYVVLCLCRDLLLW